MKKTFLYLLLCVAGMNAGAQPARVTIPGSEVRNIHSAIVNQDYELHILLPGGYSNSSKKYPVVYLMDSQWDFPLVKSLYGQQYYDGFIPGLIIVGVTWGGIRPNPDSLRVRDYTPTKESRASQSGGAANFLSFMKKELFPFIESNYKAEAGNRTLMGCSLGGLFTLFALFTEPELFTGYIAASPAYGWDRQAIYNYEKTYFEKKPAAPARLYMTMGDVERGLPGYEIWAGHLKTRNYTSLQIQSKVLENTGHSGTKGEGFSRGMQYVFERPKFSPDPALLSKYTGMYQGNNGSSAEIKLENGELALYFSPNNKYRLYAAGRNDFYSTSEYLNIHFEWNGETLSGLRLDRYGSSQQLTRK